MSWLSWFGMDKKKAKFSPFGLLFMYACKVGANSDDIKAAVNEFAERNPNTICSDVSIEPCKEGVLVSMGLVCRKEEDMLRFKREFETIAQRHHLK